MVQAKVSVSAPVLVGPAVLEQLAAAPETVHESVPIGAGFPAVPVTSAVKVIGLPTVSDNGEAVPVTEIVGVAVPRLMEIAPEVIVK
jgi:hypothetical protein